MSLTCFYQCVDEVVVVCDAEGINFPCPVCDTQYMCCRTLFMRKLQDVTMGKSLVDSKFTKDFFFREFSELTTTHPFLYGSIMEIFNKQ